jgi:hypothetical protein
MKLVKFDDVVVNLRDEDERSCIGDCSVLCGSRSYTIVGPKANTGLFMAEIEAIIGFSADMVTASKVAMVNGLAATTRRLAESERDTKAALARVEMLERAIHEANLETELLGS